MDVDLAYIVVLTFREMSVRFESLVPALHGLMAPLVKSLRAKLRRPNEHLARLRVISLRRLQYVSTWSRGQR